MRLLISVRDCVEARAALAGGADLIDIKEPRRGSLGAADPRVWRNVLGEVGNAAPVSAALGELADGGQERLAPLADGLKYVKLGLAGMACRDWKSQWRQVVKRLPPDVANVAVCYADWKTSLAPSPEEIIAVGAELSSAAVLFDTFDKTGGDLFQRLTRTDLRTFIEDARAKGMKIVLGGSINFGNIEKACSLSPDYIAVRGAVCRGERTGVVDSALVRRFAERLLAPPIGKQNGMNSVLRL